MIAADQRPPRSAQAARRRRGRRHATLPRAGARRLPARPGDLVVANDAATLPASLPACTCASGAPIEVRLAGRRSLAPDDVREFTAVVVRRRRLTARAPKTARCRRRLRRATASRSARSRRPSSAVARPSAPDRRCASTARRDAIWAGLARHGRPIQYAHVPEPLALWDVWTADRRPCRSRSSRRRPASRSTGDCSARCATRGVGFATLTHAAGHLVHRRSRARCALPFDEPYRLPGDHGARRLRATARARRPGRRASAPRSSRALEHAARAAGGCVAGAGHGDAADRPAARRCASSTRSSPARTSRDSSHYELLRAFATTTTLRRA